MLALYRDWRRAILDLPANHLDTGIPYAFRSGDLDETE